MAATLSGTRPSFARPTTVVLAGWAAVPLVGAAVSGGRGAAMGLLALAVAAGMLLEVHLPWGGRLPLGHALVIALVELLPHGWFIFVVGLGLLATWPFQAARVGEGRAAVAVGWLAVAAAAGAAGEAVGRVLTEGPAAQDERAILVRVGLAGVLYLLVDVLARGPLAPGREDRVRLRQAWPMELALLCTAALFAILDQTKGPGVAALALVPLLATRFSFERYSVARQTYIQTTQALGIVPEVAGHIPLGHAERTAGYVAAMADELGLDPEATTQVVTAARLHHIGHISLDDATLGRATPSAGDLANIGAEILHETGFLDDVATLVEEIGAEDGAEPSLAVAVVRVASTFDDLVGPDPTQAVPATVPLLARYMSGAERAAALTLVRLVNEQPTFVDAVAARSAPLMRVAEHHDDHDGHAHDDGRDCR